MFDLLKYGIQKDADLVIEQPVGGSSISRITDTNGTTTQVSNIKFNASHRLEVMLGQAKVRIDLAKIASLTCLKGEANFLLEIKGWDGNPQLAVVDGSTQVSGDIPIGEFAIALQDVANIVFEKPV
jgi:hypothetical protein